MLPFLNIYLRPANEADQPFLDALYAASRTDLQQSLLDATLLHTLIKMQQMLHETGHRTLYPNADSFILEHQGRPVGRAMLDINLTAAEMRLIHFAICPAEQRQGIGRAVVHLLQEQARCQRLALTLSVNKTNDCARRLYRAAGFYVETDDGVAEHMRWCALAVSPAPDISMKPAVFSTSAPFSAVSDRAPV